MDINYNWKSALLGLGVGYVLTREISKNANPVVIGEKRLHHYLLGLGTLFTDEAFLQGILAGAAIEDLPDLIDDLFSEYHALSDNLRKFQGKKIIWS